MKEIKPFEQLKLLYNQVLTIDKEIQEFISKELLNEAFQKTTLLKNITNQIKLVRKNIILTDEETLEINNLAANIDVDLKYTMNNLTNAKNIIQNKLNQVNKTKKIQNAYISEKQQAGQIFFDEE